jgi:crotonobetaine/carnitine-CoA ligase
MTEDEVKACVVLKPGAHLDAEELMAWCEPRMGAFMVPRFVEFLRELPKTPTEKVEKYKLRSEGNRGITPATWDRQKAGYRLADEKARKR